MSVSFGWAAAQTPENSAKNFSTPSAGSTPPIKGFTPPNIGDPVELDLSLTYGIAPNELQRLADGIKHGFSSEAVSRYEAGARAAPYAALSAAIYENKKNVRFVDRDGVAEWKLDVDLNSYGVFGFHGAVYFEPGKKEAVVVFEGTKEFKLSNPMTWTPFVIDMISNLGGAAFSDPQTVLAEPFVWTAHRKYSKLNYQVKVTGHSLGGRVAQIVGASQGLETYTFNPAAVSNLTKAAVGPINQAVVTNIVMDSDVVNPVSKGIPVERLHIANDLGKNIVFDFSVSGLSEAHSIATMSKYLQGIRLVYQDKIRGAQAAGGTGRPKSAGRTAKDALLAEFRQPNGSSKVIRSGAKVSIELCDQDGICSYYEGRAPKSEAEVWDLAFLQSYFIEQSLDGFKAANKDLAPAVLAQYSALCPSSADSAVTARCIVDRLSKRNRVRTGGVRYDEGSRCVVWMDKEFDPERDCKPY